MIILNAESAEYSPRAAATLQGLGELRLRELERAELLGALADVDVLIVRLANRIDAEVMTRAPRLKVIVTATTGLNHIDQSEARARGIEVLSLRGETEFLSSISATAEHTWGLLLALVRKLPEATASVLSGEWQRDRFRGHELSGKTLGIVGLGRLGIKVAAYGAAFGMRVAAYDPYRGDWPAHVARASSLEQLCAGVNVLSIHVPLVEETRELIGARQLSQLPVGAVLINTARGEVIDETALLDALQNGTLAGAALDVICHEIEHRLGTRVSPLVIWARQNPQRLIVTPHIGGAAFESMHKTEEFMAEKLAAHARNKGYE